MATYRMEDIWEAVRGTVSECGRHASASGITVTGLAFDAIYAIRSGFFKTDVLLEDGREQVTGFQMGGE